MDEKRVLTTLAEIKAVSDPYRYRILKLLYELEVAATVKQIADKLGEVPANVHYHIKKLEKYDIVRLEYTKEINGIIAKYYRPTAMHFEVKCTEEVEESTKKLMLGETQRILAKLYDDSKDIFLGQVEKKAHIGEGKGNGAVSVNDLYLTGDQVEELTKMIEKFFLDHKSPSGKEGEEKHHCFFSIIKLR